MVGGPAPWGGSSPLTSPDLPATKSPGLRVALLSSVNPYIKQPGGSEPRECRIIGIQTQRYYPFAKQVPKHLREQARIFVRQPRTTQDVRPLRRSISTLFHQRRGYDLL